MKNRNEQTYLRAALGLTILGLGGCLSIYSARAMGENPFYYSFRQLLWLSFGIGLFLVLSRIPFSFYKRSALWLGGIAVLGLLAVLFLGTPINGMHGWFSFGGVHLQISEFAKAPFLLLLSGFAGKTQWPERKRALLLAGSGAVFCGLVLLEPDFGSATVFFLGLAAILCTAGYFRTFFLLLGALAVPSALLFILRHEYALKRIAGYWDPDTHLYGAGWHIKQFQYTLAHGGVFGSEWGGALWSNAYLPLSHSDSVFASIVESGGVACGLLMIAGYLFMGWIFRRMALRTEDAEGRIYIFGTGVLFTAQALLHIGVNTALLPPTGLTLPIFSYGGSSLFATMIAFGIACSAARSGRLFCEKEGKTI